VMLPVCVALMEGDGQPKGISKHCCKWPYSSMMACSMQRISGRWTNDLTWAAIAKAVMRGPSTRPPAYTLSRSHPLGRLPPVLPPGLGLFCFCTADGPAAAGLGGVTASGVALRPGLPGDGEERGDGD
jgi:hypothetical protein